jgi:hypothetical protein
MADATFNTQDFINPKSMLTPGLAGGLVMIVVNGLTSAFPELPPRYLALGFSLLLALVVLSSQEMESAKVHMKCVYWLINGLIIFAVGFGTANLAADATAGGRGRPLDLGSLELVSVAHAQPAGSGSEAAAQPAENRASAPAQPLENKTGTVAKPALNEAELVKLKKMIVKLRAENAYLKKKLLSQYKIKMPPHYPDKHPPQEEFGRLKYENWRLKAVLSEKYKEQKESQRFFKKW